MKTIQGVQEPNHGAAGRWWHSLEDGRVQCDLCPRLCKLQEGQRGFCFVRQNLGGAIVLTTYGRSSGFCADPVEKKPLNHFFPGTGVLSFGTAGCNLGCRFCQNWHISKARKVDLLGDYAPPEIIAAAAREMGCKSVAFTYNDPVIFAEYAIDVADACRAAGIEAIAVTAGYITAPPRQEFFRHMTGANVDLKAFDDGFYRRRCLGRLYPVLETLKYLRHATSVWLEVTTLLIPGENDSDQELGKAADWFASYLGPQVPWHFTAFHPSYMMRNIPATPSASLVRARAIAIAHGLDYVYTGNVYDPDGGSTWCPSCSKRLIGREGYKITDWQLAGNRCAACGYAVPGRFDMRPGRWDGRILPVTLG